MSELALVTGAPSGIGLEIARQLSSRGHDIIGVGVSERVHALPDALPGATVTPVQADLGTADGVAAVWDRVAATGRPLAVAALNAGRSIGGAFLDTDLEDELRMLDFNVTGQVRLAKHMVRDMAAQRFGRILITSSSRR